LPDFYREKRYDRICDVLEKFLAVAVTVVALRFKLLSQSLKKEEERKEEELKEKEIGGES
jgi:hypothetical protein